MLRHLATAVTLISIAGSLLAQDRWLLMNTLQGTYPGWQLDSQRIQVLGWTEGSFTASSAARVHLPMGLNYEANAFLLQQNWLRVERSVLTDTSGAPTFGFRSDTILPGADYRFTLPRGIFNGQLTDNEGGPSRYGVDPIQFYVQTYFPSIAQGLDLKVGRILCQYGVETIDAPPNALASHSYTFIYNPFTHTGAMATVQLTPDWSVHGGPMLGPDVFVDSAASPYGMFGIKWAPPNGADSAYLGGVLGSGRFDVDEQFNNPNILDLVYSHGFSPSVSYTLDALVGYQTNVPAIGTATWFGTVNYLTCKVTPRLSATTRVELFCDRDGNRTGFSGLYSAITSGLNFRPTDFVICRPELRFDYNNESRPFEDEHGLFTAAMDFIVRW
jgi:hypothetical protein